MLVRSAWRDAARVLRREEPVEKPVPVPHAGEGRSFWLLVVQAVVAVAGLAAVFVHSSRARHALLTALPGASVRAPRRGGRRRRARARRAQRGGARVAIAVSNRYERDRPPDRRQDVHRVRAARRAVRADRRERERHAARRRGGGRCARRRGRRRARANASGCEIAFRSRRSARGPSSSVTRAPRPRRRRGRRARRRRVVAGAAAVERVSATVWAKARAARAARPLRARRHHFAALHTVYVTDMDVGLARYGSAFRSAAWLVREHLYGATDHECDHWHDDAGFPRTTSPSLGSSAEPAGDRPLARRALLGLHDRLERGRRGWPRADLRPRLVRRATRLHAAVTRAAGRTAAELRARRAITNPHGLLRSPWNTNPTPFLTRHDTVLGLYADEYSLRRATASRRRSRRRLARHVHLRAQRQAAGPVHIMIGGHWFSDFEGPLWFGNATGDRRACCAIPNMWRQSCVRYPVLLARRARAGACACPSDIIGDAPIRDAAPRARCST